METFQKILSEERKLKPRTIAAYSSNLNKLSTLLSKKEYENNDIFKDKDQVMKVLNGYKVHTKKMYLCSVLNALSPSAKSNPLKGYEELYKYYNSELKKTNKVYYEEKITQVKNKKEEKNWIEYETLCKHADKLYDNVYNEFSSEKTIQRAVISQLYTKLPPRRSCYASCIVITQDKYKEFVCIEKTIKTIKNKYNVETIKDDEFIVSTNNYLIINNINEMKPLFFSLGNLKSKVNLENPIKNKTVHFNDMACKIDIKNSTKLFLIIKHLMFQRKNRFNKKVINEPLFYDRKGNVLSSNGLSKIVKNIFTIDGKMAGITMCRHIYISHMYKKDIGLLKKLQLAYFMNHSVKVAEAIYAKRTDNNDNNNNNNKVEKEAVAPTSQ